MAGSEKIYYRLLEEYEFYNWVQLDKQYAVMFEPPYKYRSHEAQSLLSYDGRTESTITVWSGELIILYHMLNKLGPGEDAIKVFRELSLIEMIEVSDTVPLHKYIVEDLASQTQANEQAG